MGLTSLVPRHLGVLVGSVASMLACNDRGAYVTGVNGGLALGAYHSLGFGDACPGGGKINFCSTEGVTEILELRSDDPDIVEILPGAKHPLGALATSSYYMLGKKDGKTALFFRGRFNDGSVRDASVEVEVKHAELLRLASACGSAPAETNLLVSTGDTGTFELEMLAGGEKLSGWLPGAVTAEGLTDTSGNSDINYYAWQAPETPIVRALESTLAAKVVGTLTAYGPDQVTSIDISSRDTLFPAAFTAEGSFYIYTQIHVGDKSPCRSLPVEIHSSALSVCSGPAGEAVWMGDAYGGEARVHAEGNCVLAASTPGGKALSSKSFPLFFVNAPPTGLDVPGFGNPCTIEGATACSFGYGSVGVCKSGHWMEKLTCSENQTCDFVPQSSKGCVAGASCAVCRGLW